MTPAVRQVVLMGGVRAAVYGLIAKTGDGSVGQTYTVTAAWAASARWYRETPGTGIRTVIGTSGPTYVAQVADVGYRLVAIAGRNAAASYEVVLAAPTLFEGFEATTGWAAAANNTLALDATRQVQGAGDLSFLGNGTSGANTNTLASAGGGASFDPGTFGVVSYYVDFGDDPEGQNQPAVDIRFGRSGTYYTASGTTGPNGLTAANIGGRWVSFNVSEVATLPGLGSGTMGLRYVVTQAAPSAGKSYVDALYTNSAGRPTLIITCDDCYASQATVLEPLLTARGLKATCFVAPGYLGAGGGKMADVSVLQGLAAKGWGMQANGTYNDGAMTAAADMAAALANIASVKQFIIDNGLNTSANIKHFCYPNGTTDIAGAVVQVASVTGAGTAVVTMASTTGIIAGMKASGSGVPAGTTVVSNDSATQLTLSASIPSQTKAMSFTNTSGAFHTDKLQTALAAAGWKTGRLTTTGLICSRFGFGANGTRRALRSPSYSGSTQTAVQMQADLDAAILRGATIVRYFHDFTSGTATGLQTNTAEMTTFLDYVKTKVDAGLLDVMTLADWYARDGAASCP